MRSGVGCNHANDDINKSKNEMKIERKRAVDLAFLEGDTWNITTYKLVPDLWGDSFVIGYHVPQGVGWWRGQDGGKGRGIPDVCNT